MTVRESATALEPVERSSATSAWGGGGLAVAGALQALGGLGTVLPSTVAAWRLLGWLVGGSSRLFCSRSVGAVRTASSAAPDGDVAR